MYLYENTQHCYASYEAMSVMRSTSVDMMLTISPCVADFRAALFIVND